MKILLINYRYFFSGGPEKYMFGVKKLLEKHGHEVIPFSVKSGKNVKTEYEPYFAEPIGNGDQVYFEEYKKDFKTILQMLDRQFYSLHVRKRVETLIKETKPDVAYLMHHYNKLSPSVIDACKKNKVPVVMRLSDFFLACPSALFTRDCKACEECASSLLNCIKHRCVKNSLPSSVIKIAAIYFHRLLKIYNKVNCIAAPAQFTINKLKPLYPKNKFAHIPTFINKTEDYNSNPGDYALYVGRVEEEKGVLDAVKAISSSPYKLKIAGSSSTGHDKEIKEFIQKNNLKNIKLLGAVHGEELRQLYRNARAVIIPAVWYENMPNVALEAMMHSRPIIASDIGSLRELVKDNYNGLLFEPGNIKQLREKIGMIFNDRRLCKDIGRNAYTEASRKYGPEKHYERLMEIFNKSIGESNKTNK